MNNKTAKNIGKSATFKFMIESFFEGCEPEFEWKLSAPYKDGDHPDYGGGRTMRDIEDATLIGTRSYSFDDLSRHECVEAFGRRFVEAVEQHAVENHETYYKGE